MCPRSSKTKALNGKFDDSVAIPVQACSLDIQSDPYTRLANRWAQVKSFDGNDPAQQPEVGVIVEEGGCLGEVVRKGHPKPDNEAGASAEVPIDVGRSNSGLQHVASDSEA